jgi:hypothetical protein
VDQDDNDIQSRPVWDEKLANELIGKVVLVGLTHLSSNDAIIKQEQVLGASNVLTNVTEFSLI